MVVSVPVLYFHRHSGFVPSLLECSSDALLRNGTSHWTSDPWHLEPGTYGTMLAYVGRSVKRQKVPNVVVLGRRDLEDLTCSVSACGLVLPLLAR